MLDSQVSNVDMSQISKPSLKTWWRLLAVSKLNKTVCTMHIKTFCGFNKVKDNSIPGCCDHLSQLDSLQDPPCYFQSVYLDSSLEVCNNLGDNQLTTAIIKCYLLDQTSCGKT